MADRRAYEHGFDDAVDLMRIGAKYLGHGVAQKIADDVAKARDDQASLWEARAETNASEETR